ncbi:MAG: DUF1819 family protein [Desulfamplus sp.]|nr:DUF1819 family protein [Desulfamplus sp.]
MTNLKSKIYSGEIVAGALLLEESRKVARLLIDDVNTQEWYQAVVIDNILQKRSPEAAKRQARLIRSRLLLMTGDLWKMVVEGTSETTSQALLAASIKYSRLVGDFMDTVLRQHWLTFIKQITATDWKDYLEQCSQIDPQVEEWKESTRSKLKQIVFRMLAEANYIDSTKTCKLIPVSIVPEVRGYLVKHNETYVLRCMEIS